MSLSNSKGMEAFPNEVRREPRIGESGIFSIKKREPAPSKAVSEMKNITDKIKRIFAEANGSNDSTSK